MKNLNFLIIFLVLLKTLPVFAEKSAVKIDGLEKFFKSPCDSIFTSHGVHTPLRIEWNEIKSDRLLTMDLTRILRDPKSVLNELKQLQWTAPLPTEPTAANFAELPLRYEIVPCRSAKPEDCGVIVAPMGIGYSWARFQDNRDFLAEWTAHHHVIYLEMPGQGESYKLRTVLWSLGLDDIRRRAILRNAEKFEVLLEKFRKKTVLTTPAEIRALSSLSQDLGRDLFAGERRDWIREQYSTLKEKFFATVQQIVLQDLKKKPEDVQFVALSWGGWFMTSVLSQNPPFLGRGLILLDPGVGWLGSLLSSVYRQVDNGLQTVYNTMDGFRSVLKFFHIPDRLTSPFFQPLIATDGHAMEPEVSGVHDVLARYKREYLLDPVARAGAVAMTMMMREQNGMTAATTIPAHYPVTLVVAPEGQLLPPKLQYDFANALINRAEGSQTQVLVLRHAQHDLPVENRRIQRFMSAAAQESPGLYIGHQEMKNIETLTPSQFESLMKQAQTLYPLARP